MSKEDILVSPKMKCFLFYLLKQNFVFKKMFPHLFSVIFPHMTYLANHFGSSQTCSSWVKSKSEKEATT